MALRDDEELLRAKRQASLRLRQQFFDPAHSWGRRFEQALARHGLVEAP